MNLSFLLDGNDSYGINCMRIDRTDRRMLNEHLFEKMRTLHVKESLIKMFRCLSLAVDHFNGLSARTEIRLCYELIVIFYEADDLIFIVFPDRDPLSGEEFAEMLIELRRNAH